MRKKRLSTKLHLSRETVRNLNPDELGRIAAGNGSGSENCTLAANCGQRPSDGGRSYCICPLCPEQTFTCDTTGPIWTAAWDC